MNTYYSGGVSLSESCLRLDVWCDMVGVLLTFGEAALVLVTGCDSTIVLMGTRSGTASITSRLDSPTVTSMSSTWKKIFVINIM